METGDISLGKGADEDVRRHFDAITRKYLLSVLSDDLIEEHRRKPSGHHSEPLARLLAWCHRRPASEQYLVRKTKDDEYRIARMSGERGVIPKYASDAVFSSVDEARHGIVLQHIKDLVGG